MNTFEPTRENGTPISNYGSAKEHSATAEITSIDMATLSSRSFGEMVNLPELMERIDHDSELLREILDLFCHELPAIHSDLRTAIHSGVLSSTQSKAHTLKGMFANLAFTHATAVAAELEQMARSGDQGGLTDALATLDDEVSSLLPCVERFLAGTQR